MLRHRPSKPSAPFPRALGRPGAPDPSAPGFPARGSRRRLARQRRALSRMQGADRYRPGFRSPTSGHPITTVRASARSVPGFRSLGTFCRSIGSSIPITRQTLPIYRFRTSDRSVPRFRSLGTFCRSIGSPIPITRQTLPTDRLPDPCRSARGCTRNSHSWPRKPLRSGYSREGGRTAPDRARARQDAGFSELGAQRDRVGISFAKAPERRSKRARTRKPSDRKVGGTLSG